MSVYYRKCFIFNIAQLTYRLQNWNTPSKYVSTLVWGSILPPKRKRSKRNFWFAFILHCQNPRDKIDKYQKHMFFYYFLYGISDHAAKINFEFIRLFQIYKYKLHKIYAIYGTNCAADWHHSHFWWQAVPNVSIAAFGFWRTIVLMKLWAHNWYMLIYVSGWRGYGSISKIFPF